jgi:hypothetical protein
MNPRLRSGQRRRLPSLSRQLEAGERSGSGADRIMRAPATAPVYHDGSRPQPIGPDSANETQGSGRRRGHFQSDETRRVPRGAFDGLGYGGPLRTPRRCRVCVVASVVAGEVGCAPTARLSRAMAFASLPASGG